MNFDLSSDQKLLVDTVANFLRKESPVSRLRTMRENPVGYSKDLWRQMGELGWLAIGFSEEAGGLGGSFVDVSLILEKFGTTLVPEPYIPSVVLAGSVLASLATPEQRQRWLEPAIAGQTTLALAYAEREGRFDPCRVATRAASAGGGYKLSGEKTFVLNGHAADAVIVSARTSGGVADHGGISAFVVDPKSAGVTVRAIKTMDGHRAAIVTLQDVVVGAQDRLGADGGAGAALERALDRAAAAACAEGIGIMQTVLGMTRDYLCTREQFGVKIGTFQALQHRCVDMFVETELAKSLSILASIKADEVDDVDRKTAISAAKVQLALSGRFVTQQGIQLHGGIGVTDEHDVGLYFKRMQILNTLFGDEEHHLTRFASLPTFTERVTET
ncbi:MAG TPA: acyl-CoA dehydrogenase [Polyangiaceae bacterium]|nr:acyl-CoA dehydrogenase [Polyangiaceae bacterium]